MEYYTDNIKNELGAMCSYVFFDEWYGIVEDILLNQEFQKRKFFAHHHNVSVFQHCVDVSYRAFIAAKYFNADQRVCAIAGILHDFYPKAWLYTPELAELDSSYLSELTFKRPLFQRHGFTHAGQSLENCKLYFPDYLDKKIENCILRHMFPLNIHPPKYKEAWIITLVDKGNSMFELPSIKELPKKFISKPSKLVHNKI